MTPEPPYLGNAMVYQRADALYVCAQDRTDWKSAGYLVQTEHVTRLPTDVGADELGRAVAGALNAGKAGVPPPPRGEIGLLIAPLLRAAGVRSWRAYLRGTLACFVERETEAITFAPSAGGTKDARNGFVVLPGLEVHVRPDAAPSEIGLAVRAALAHCITATSAPSAR